MQEKLIIYLHTSNLSRPGWAVMDENGQIRQSVYEDSTDDLAALANQKSVLVIVPAEEVILTEVTLPKMSRSRLLQAIPFALEEQLIDDVENLHFAMAESNKENNVSVAIVAHHKMQSWLALLDTWHVRADAILPASLTLPFTKDSWQVIVSEQILVRTAELAGFGCDQQNLEMYLNAALSNAESLPEHVIIRNYTQHRMAEMLDLPVPIKEELFEPEHLMEQMAQQAGNHLPLDLLQGIYSINKKARLPKLNNLKGAIAFLSCIMFVLLLIYPTGSYLILKQRENHLQNQISQIYRQHFPEAKIMVAPKLRMEDKLNKLKGEMGENPLLLLLGYIGKGLSQTQGIHLNRFDFQNRQLTMELTAANSQDFSAFNAFLVQERLQVKQQNAVLTGERVNATLQVE